MNGKRDVKTVNLRNGWELIASVKKGQTVFANGGWSIIFTYFATEEYKTSRTIENLARELVRPMMKQFCQKYFVVEMTAFDISRNSWTYVRIPDENTQLEKKSYFATEDSPEYARKKALLELRAENFSTPRAQFKAYNEELAEFFRTRALIERKMKNSPSPTIDNFDESQYTLVASTTPVKPTTKTKYLEILEKHAADMKKFDKICEDMHELFESWK